MLQYLAAASLLVALVTASNEVRLTNIQNITIPAPLSNQTVHLCKFSSAQSILAVGMNSNILTFYSFNGSAYTWSYTVNFTNTIYQHAAFRNDGRWMAVLSSSGTLYMLFKSGQYSINHTINTSTSATSVSWGLNGERLLVGLINGQVLVLAYNSTDAKYNTVQAIQTSHTIVYRISGTMSRFATCGNDNKVLIYYFNLTTQEYSLNDTATLSGPPLNCSSLDFAQTETRILVGKYNGNIDLLEKDRIFNYELSTRQGADTLKGTIAKFTSDGAEFLTGGPANLTTLYQSQTSAGVSNLQVLSQTVYSVDWNKIRMHFAVGRQNSTVSIYELRASNCTTASVNTTYPTQCMCPIQEVWQYGSCNTLNCTIASSNITQCPCPSNYVWDTMTNQCVIDCLTVPNSNGTSYQFLSCFCTETYYWNYTFRACTRNCSGISHSNGSNINATTCFCTTGYAWNSSSLNCQCSSSSCAVSCLAIAHTRPNPDNYSECICLSFFTNVSGKCVVNCSAVPYGTAETTDTGACKCQSKYGWDQRLQACVSDNSNSSRTIAIGVGVGVGGALAIAAIIGAAIAISAASTPVVVAAPVQIVTGNLTSGVLLPGVGPSSSFSSGNNLMIASKQANAPFATIPPIIVPPNRRKLRVFTE